jgi:hypothetical protein
MDVEARHSNTVQLYIVHYEYMHITICIVYGTVTHDTEGESTDVSNKLFKDHWLPPLQASRLAVAVGSARFPLPILTFYPYGQSV